jgi:hypothetical protein
MVVVATMANSNLFSANKGEPGNALLNWGNHPARELASYAATYRYAANNLVAFREQQPPHAVDEGALPIVFLYRHSFELYLKAIIYRAALSSMNEGEVKRALPRLWREHSLVKLTKMAAPVIESKAHLLTRTGDLHRCVSDLSAEIDRIDASSHAFRYPIDAQGTASLPRNFWVNIFAFSEAMERMLDDVAQFCRSLESARIETSEQLKLALHLNLRT